MLNCLYECAHGALWWTGVPSSVYSHLDGMKRLKCPQDRSWTRHKPDQDTLLNMKSLNIKELQNTICTFSKNNSLNPTMFNYPTMPCISPSTQKWYCCIPVRKHCYRLWTTPPYPQSRACAVWLVWANHTWLGSLLCVYVCVSAWRFAAGASQAAWWIVVRSGDLIDTGGSVAEEQVRPAELEIPLKFNQIQGAAVGGWSTTDLCPFGTCRPCCLPATLRWTGSWLP